MDKNEKKSGKRAVIIGGILLILVLIVIIAALLFILLRKEEPNSSADQSGGYVIREENYQQIQEEIEANVKEGYFETYMSVDWKFPDGVSEAEDAVLGNSPNNTKPIRCEVLLKDSGETVFSTGVIPVGAQLPSIKLDVDLDAGKYDAVCMVYLLDELEDGTYKDYSNAGFNITITVEN